MIWLLLSLPAFAALTPEECVQKNSLRELACVDAESPACATQTAEYEAGCKDVGPAVAAPTARIDTWEAKKLNDSLLDQDPLLKSPSANATQKDNFILQSNVMYGCVENSVDGRSDEACKNDPGNPECVGLSRALANATTCKEFFEPASLGCKTYGAGEYTMEEWIAVGEQFHGTMKNCVGVKNVTDDTTDRLVNLTEMLAPKPGQAAPKAPELQVESDISGTGKTIWDMLSEKFSDGASSLGYANGEIFRGTGKGESYAEKVIASPFAEKLNALHKQRLEAALADSSFIAQRLANKLREKNNPPMIESVEDDRMYTSSLVGSTVSSVSGNTTEGNVANTGEIPFAAGTPPTASDLNLSKATASLPNSGATPPLPTAAPTESASAQNTATQPAPRRMTESERIEALQAELLAKRRAQSQGRELASTKDAAPRAQSSEYGEPTLFQRVRGAYRRQSVSLTTGAIIL